MVEYAELTRSGGCHVVNCFQISTQVFSDNLPFLFPSYQRDRVTLNIYLFFIN